MARLIPYTNVLQTAEAVGLRCVYPNGAAFAPAAGDWSVAGWVTGEDVTLRPQFRQRVIHQPREALGPAVARAWREQFANAAEAWIAPVHHWAAELDHGEHPQAITAALERADLDVTPLLGRRQADAVAVDDPTVLARLVNDLFDAMGKSDFALLLPPARIVVTLHHHGQAWWRCADAVVADALLQR